MKRSTRYLLSCLGVLVLASGAWAADVKAPSASEAAQLGKDLLALFQSRCLKCHGAEKPKARLILTGLEGVARGSENGPVVAPGMPGESVLWQVVREGKMPPKAPLTPEEKRLVHRWIEAGAPGLPSGDSLAGAATHWAFVPPARPP